MLPVFLPAAVWHQRNTATSELIVVVTAAAVLEQSLYLLIVFVEGTAVSVVFNFILVAATDIVHHSNVDFDAAAAP
jgi:hypothetical protein